MTKYYSREIVDNKGVNIKFLAPEVNIEDIKIDTYPSENGIAVFIPDNSFFYAIKHTEKLYDTLNASDAQATLERGVLTLFVPFNESKQPKRIEIKEIKAIT